MMEITVENVKKTICKQIDEDQLQRKNNSQIR